MRVKILLPALSIFVLALAFGSFVGCGNNPAASENDAALAPGVDGNGNADVQEPSYTASVSVPNDDDDPVQLSKLAKITSDQATQAALAEVPGTVIETELENENGNVVYCVEIDTEDGVKDVKVDAGDGKILHVEAGEDNADEIGDVEDDEPGGLESNHEFDGEEEGEH